MISRKLLLALASLLLLGLAYQAYGWAGLAAVCSAIVMWMLLHFTRLMAVLKRAANRPIGHVGSAVMFNAKLKQGVTLMHVIAMTQSLGERLSPEGEQPERFRWSDGGDSAVTAEFRAGRLVCWTLVRPAADGASPAAGAGASQADPAP